VAIPIECTVIPSNLVSGDLIKIFFENNNIIDKIEVKGVDEKNRIITIVTTAALFDSIRGKKGSLVVALPNSTPKPQTISVEQTTGEIEDFKFQRIVRSLKRVEVNDELANKIVTKVQSKLSKMDPPSFHETNQSSSN
jgi:hypothetical protein